MTSPRRNVTVVGAGPVGLATAVGLADLGHTVELVEVDPARLAALERDELPFFEPTLGERYADVRALGHLRLSSTTTAGAEMVLVCVGTPIGRDGRVDVAQLMSALTELAPLARAGVPIVIRSTLPPSGTDGLATALALPRAHLLTNPEFLSEGSAMHDFMRPYRIVIGRFPETRPDHVEMLAGLFDWIDAPVRVLDVVAAEIAKNAANAYLATRLSFINEISALSEAFDSDVGPALLALSDDPRIGRDYLRPSLGYGGSCLPNASLVLDHAARERGVELDLMRAVVDSNRAHQRRFADRVRRARGAVAGQTVGLLGLAFKAGTDDVRDSAAVELARELVADGGVVQAYDPRVAELAADEVAGVTITSSALAAVSGAHAAVIATDWPEFAALDWMAVRDVMARPVVVDGRRIADGAVLRALGFIYIAVGGPGASTDRA